MGEAEFDMQITANLAGALAKLLARGNSSETLDYRLVGECQPIQRFSAPHPV